MARVYAWPPVSAIGFEWTEAAPISESFGLGGARFASAYQRARRVARFTVSAIGQDRAGAGYCEMLKRMLAGGEHLVRLYSMPINRINDAAALAGEPGRGGGRSIEWSYVQYGAQADLGWTTVVGGASAALRWVSGSLVPATPTTDAAGWPAIAVTGLTPSALVARPGEFVAVYGADGTVARRQVLTVARSDAAGAATIRLYEAVTAAGQAAIGAPDTGVFFHNGPLPRAQQPLASNWSYDWEFLEVFEDETDGFTEIDPWR